MTYWRILRNGLSSLRDRAANLRCRLAGSRFNPLRVPAFDDRFGPDYEAKLARIIEDVKPPSTQIERLAEIGRERGWKTR
jgi:hypothetical protein